MCFIKIKDFLIYHLKKYIASDLRKDSILQDHNSLSFTQ